MLLGVVSHCFAELSVFSNDVATIRDEIIPARHWDVREERLRRFAHSRNLNDDEMIARLIAIARPILDSTNLEECRLRDFVISHFVDFPSTNAIVFLGKLVREGRCGLVALHSYQLLTHSDQRYFDACQTALKNGTLAQDVFRSSLRDALETDRKVTAESKCRLIRWLVTNPSENIGDVVYTDAIICRHNPSYANSVQRRAVLSDLLGREKEDSSIKKLYYEGRMQSKGVVLSTLSNELARTMALPEEECVNMTAILDAQIAAIEEAEERAARRAIWRRRLRNAGLLLPITVLVLLACRVRWKGDKIGVVKGQRNGCD